MVPPRDAWTSFKDEEDRLSHYRQWGLISANAKQAVKCFYTGFYASDPIPCEVLGHQKDRVAIIQVGNDLHCIDGEYFAALQPRRRKKTHKVQNCESTQATASQRTEQVLFELHNNPEAEEVRTATNQAWAEEKAEWIKEIRRLQAEIKAKEEARAGEAMRGASSQAPMEAKAEIADCETVLQQFGALVTYFIGNMKRKREQRINQLCRVVA